MNGFNINKIITAFLFASLVIMVISITADLLYNPEEVPEDRGYTIPTTNNSSNAKNNVNNNAISIEEIAQLISEGNAENGKKIVKTVCSSCHTFEKGEANRIGPNLWKIIGNNKGHLGDSFSYSKALINKGGKWDYESLFMFLHKPQSYIKGTRMSFAGISQKKKVADVLLYLRTLSDNPEPLPAVKLQTQENQNKKDIEPTSKNEHQQESTELQKSEKNIVNNKSTSQDQNNK